MPELRSPFAKGFTPFDASVLASALKAVASTSRLRIVHQLHVHGPLTVLQLQSQLGLSQGTVSTHLHVLESARLVEVAPDTPKTGTFRPRRLNPDAWHLLHAALALDGGR